MLPIQLVSWGHRFFFLCHLSTAISMSTRVSASGLFHPGAVGFFSLQLLREQPVRGIFALRGGVPQATNFGSCDKWRALPRPHVFHP